MIRAPDMIQLGIKRCVIVYQINHCKEKFIGRNWLYRELEFLHTVHANDVTGVLITKHILQASLLVLPEYGNIVSDSSFTIHDPVGCFKQAILSPLKNLTNVPKENWYVVIDALDECLTQSETSHSIVYLLRQKLLRFPSWLKLVLISHNDSSVSLNSNSGKKLIIDPEDPRNLKDIELFLSTRFYRDIPLLRQL